MASKMVPKSDAWSGVNYVAGLVGVHRSVCILMRCLEGCTEKEDLESRGVCCPAVTFTIFLLRYGCKMCVYAVCLHPIPPFQEVFVFAMPISPTKWKARRLNLNAWKLEGLMAWKLEGSKAWRLEDLGAWELEASGSRVVFPRNANINRDLRTIPTTRPTLPWKTVRKIFPYFERIPPLKHCLAQI